MSIQSILKQLGQQISAHTPNALPPFSISSGPQAPQNNSGCGTPEINDMISRQMTQPSWFSSLSNNLSNIGSLASLIDDSPDEFQALTGKTMDYVHGFMNRPGVTFANAVTYHEGLHSETYFTDDRRLITLSCLNGVVQYVSVSNQKPAPPAMLKFLEGDGKPETRVSLAEAKAWFLKNDFFDLSGNGFTSFRGTVDGKSNVIVELYKDDKGRVKMVTTEEPKINY